MKKVVKPAEGAHLLMETVMLLAKSFPNEALGCPLILSLVPCAVLYHSTVVACARCMETVSTAANTAVILGDISVAPICTFFASEVLSMRNLLMSSHNMAHLSLQSVKNLLDGRSLPVLGLGTYLGTPEAVTKALDLDYRLIDTASLYE